MFTCNPQGGFCVVADAVLQVGLVIGLEAFDVNNDNVLQEHQPPTCLSGGLSRVGSFFVSWALSAVNLMASPRQVNSYIGHCGSSLPKVSS